MKRDPQVFSWSCEKGVLKIEGRKDSGFDGIRRVYDLANYPEEIVGKIRDAGFKAIFQQRTSQIDDNDAKLEAWEALDAMFCAGTWEREGVRGAPVVAAWVEALAEVKGTDVGAIQKALAGYTKEQRDKMRKNVEAKHAAVIARITGARGAEAVDLTDLA